MDLGVSSWNDLPETFNTDRRFETTDTTTDSRRFYRLFRQNDLLARIQPQGVGRPASSPFLNLVITEQDPDYRVFRAVLIRNQVSYIFDFSQTINPRISSRSGLRYRWSIEYEDAAIPNPYLHPGIQGHDSPVLRIAPNSLPNTGAQGLTFRLYVDDPADPVPYRGVSCSINASVINGIMFTPP
jgi:hypothetical protein